MLQKKIIFLNGFSCGGAERMTILYSKILQNAGFDCKIITQFKPTEAANATILSFIPDDMKHEEVVCRYRYYAYHLFKVLRREKPDVVFCSIPVIARVLCILKQLHLCNAKLVFRCINTPSLKDASFNHMLKTWYPYADKVIAQTKEMEQELIMICGLKSDKVITINNPIDKSLIEEKIKETFAYDHSYINYLGVGRISPEKNFSNLIKAFALVHRQQPLSRLYIVGNENSIDEKKALTNLVQKENIQDAVFFEGFQNNPFKYSKACDCFVLSSNIEGLPNVLLEAMYLGRPVAATTCIPYISQVVTDGVNGYICPIKDSEALAEAMTKAVKLKNLPMFNDIGKSEEMIIEVFDNVSKP